MGRHVQLRSKSRRRRFLEEICSAFEKVCPQGMKDITAIIDLNRKQLARADGGSASGRIRFSTSLPMHFTRFVEKQAKKRGIVGPNEDFFRDYDNLQLLFQIWPDLKLGRGSGKTFVDMKKEH